MSVFLQDVRYGLRMLIKSPAFTAIALVTLALGIGVNSALFSVLHAMHVRPQQLPEPEELVLLWGASESEPPGSYIAVGALDYLDWRAEARSFAEMGLFKVNGRILANGGGEPARIKALEATAGVMPMLGIHPLIGRLHTAEEDAVDAERVVLLTDRLWRNRFGASRDVLGQTMLIDEQPHAIVGVLPAELDRMSLWYEIDVLTPLSIDPAQIARGRRGWQALARLAPGVSLAQAQTEMSGIAARLTAAYPATNRDEGVWVQPLMAFFRPPEHRVMESGLLIAVGIVLLIACVNLANLLVAKATGRGREFAVRAALGAGRSRIVRQLLTESVLVALLGGGLGLLLGLWALDILMVSFDTPFRPDEIGLNPAVLLYTLLVSLGAALAFGLAPALTASRVSLSEALKEGAPAASAGRTRNRLRNTLVAGQLAVAVPLLIGCGLVIKSLVALRTADLGFEIERRLTMRIDLPTYRYGEAVQQSAFFRESLERIRALPGVEQAAAVSNLPLGGISAATSVMIEGRASEELDDRSEFVRLEIVTPAYFATMGIPLITGRYLTEHDLVEGEPVAVVNQQMARRYWPNEDPLGRRFKRGRDAERWLTVVGVVGDACQIGAERPPEPEIYLSYLQTPSPGMAIVAKTAGDPEGLIPLLSSAIHELDPGLPIHGIRTMAAIVAGRSADQRVLAGMLAGLAALALGLACVGLYGVMSFAVAQRTHELGVRVALGAGQGDILRLVLGRCLVLAGAGVTIGLLLATPVGFAMASELYGVGGFDPLTFLVVAAVLLVVALLAGYVPARRAIRIDPIVALRCE